MEPYLMEAERTNKDLLNWVGEIIDRGAGRFF